MTRPFKPVVYGDKLNKERIVQRIRNKIRIPESHIHLTVNAFLEVIADALAHGEEVQLMGLGKMQRTTRKYSGLYNIHTEERLPDRVVQMIKFKPSKYLLAEIRKDDDPCQNTSKISSVISTPSEEPHQTPLSPTPES